MKQKKELSLRCST